MIKVQITPDIAIGNVQPLLILSGPCVMESEELCLQIARFLQSLCKHHGLNYIFKASFDKANRTSAQSFRGPGLNRGIEILEIVKKQLSVPVLTDVHEPEQVERVAEVVDIIQIPAFLCRQTDLLIESGKSGRTVNIKKGQFLAPEDMLHCVEKVLSTGNSKVLLTERGTTFGYHNLVVDMRGLSILRSLGYPVIFDATHSVQLPGGKGKVSGGQREFISPLARGASGVGIDGLFLETHPEPEKAKSDGANSIPLEAMEKLLLESKMIHELVRKSSID